MSSAMFFHLAEFLHFYVLSQDSIYEYTVDIKNKTWASFEDKLPKDWRYNTRLEMIYCSAYQFISVI